MSRIIAGLVAAAMMVVVAGGVAEAKGPKGPGGGTETLSVAPAAAAAVPQAVTDGGLIAGGEWYVIQGSGFAADQPVYLAIREPFCCAATTLLVSEDGTFGVLRSTKTPGTYTIDAMVKRGGKVVTVATVTFEVAAGW